MKIITAIVATSLFIYPLPTGARYFDANDIFTDAELFDSNSLSRTATQQFLESKNSILKSVNAIVEGVPKLVSEMVYEIAKKYGISQKFLLAKLQHEQGLIEKSTASQTALDWATGYSCFNNRCNDKYKGIYAQLDAAADIQKIYSERSQSKNYFGYSKGQESTTSDGFKVRPVNQATTNLYIYTPYRGGTSGVGGNYAFWRVWNRYFTERVYPDGTVLFDPESGQYWRIENNKKRLFSSAGIYLSDYKPEDAVVVDKIRLGYYDTGKPITFSNNSVVKAEKAGLTYFLSDGFKHRVAGSEALALLTVRAADVASEPIVVADSILDNYQEGEPVTADSVYPQGILVISPSRSILLLKNGTLFPLYDEAVWIENFDGIVPAAFKETELAKYPKGEPVKLKDGSVVKNNAGVYFIISVGEKHPVSGAEIIDRVYGQGAAARAPVASSALLDLHPTTDTIDYINASIPDPDNYVSYAQRLGASGQTGSSEQAYLAIYDTLAVPRSMLAQASEKVTVRFRNRGGASWPAGGIYLKLIDENKNSSSFLADNLIALPASAGPGELAEFNFSITAPAAGQKIKEWFILTYKDAAGNLTEMTGGLVGLDIETISGNSAQIAKHNVPVAVRNTWKPVTVSMEIKNTSQDATWTSRRTALILAAPEGESPFYDKNDWLTREVVGVPLNKSAIKPAETGLFRFTLDPRGLSKGVYKLRFTLEQKDSQKQVYLSAGGTWERLIRVD